MITPQKKGDRIVPAYMHSYVEPSEKVATIPEDQDISKREF